MIMKKLLQSFNYFQFFNIKYEKQLIFAFYFYVFIFLWIFADVQW